MRRTASQNLETIAIETWSRKMLLLWQGPTSQLAHPLAWLSEVLTRSYQLSSSVPCMTLRIDSLGAKNLKPKPH